MKHTLSFCTIDILSNNIAEMIVNKGIEISIEMVEELEGFLANNFTQSFALLINKINLYDLSFEAKLCICSDEKLKAIAVILYNEKSKSITDNVFKIRKMDNWNLKSFSGLELGRQQGLDWLKKELSVCGE